MTQRSFPWANGKTHGGPYTADALRFVWKALTLGIQTGNSGVVRGGLTNLLVQNPSGTTIRLRTGRALVDNVFYENDANIDTVVTTPSVGTTGGIVKLVKDWTGGSVVLSVVRNTDGTAAIPTLTQTDGVTWEVALASFTITTGGVITLTDMRGGIVSGGVTGIPYLPAPDSQRSRWFPVTGGTTMTVQGTHVGAQLATGSTSHGYIGFRVPDDYKTLVSAVLTTVTGATGNIQREIDLQRGLVGTAYNTATATIGPGTRNMTANLFNEEDISALLSGISAGENIGIDYWRDGANAADVNTATTLVTGVSLVYTVI